ncbi:hypothetical protein J9B83_11635 [Marinomonas sp. A79]|uniref:Lysozyme inhibitor LprI N-terminal domain-containing protein n=1 Tax=Marinomonas vulgaris TaxID=2823372 RepID=A0ABS5HDT3_9GAMM|nr:hypothetical protein [Marinomonas vulgaris]MBR7889594.1 hypothetical protein [Marinomonas vulgaris]
MLTKYAFARVIYCLLVLLAFSLTAVAHGNESLIAFGKACLAKEAQLQRTQARITDRAVSNEFNRRDTFSSAPDTDLKQNQREKETLQATLEECAANTPNSAFCHQARQRNNELTYLIDKAKTASIKEHEEQEDSTNEENIRRKFDENYARFIAQCRDSDAHYALIQNPTAYQAVCSEEGNKQSITCSFF